MVRLLVLLFALGGLGCNSWSPADTTATVRCVSRCAQSCLEEFARARAEQKACPADKP
jgi:hypothetical protein